MRAAVAAMLALAGCYSPALRDCVLACSSDADCAAGQSCTGGLCAASGTTCGDPHDPVDSAIGSPPPPADASVEQHATDAEPPRDAPAVTLVAITIGVLGMGSVTIGATTCTFTCTVQVPIDQAVVAVAAGKGDDAFGAWTSSTCKGQGATCSFTPAAPALLDVVFVKQK